MTEEMELSVETYKLQLEQVEAALTTDPDNEELIKLKGDLEEVLTLTKELIRSQESAASSSKSKDDSDDDMEPGREWKVGDKCAAKRGSDGQYYAAVIDEITDDGQVNITFTVLGVTEVVKIGVIRDRSVMGGEPIAGSVKLQLEHANRMSRKKHVEYLKKRKQKKLQRFKQLEEEREQEKNKWQNFSQKAFKKKGFVKRSIFASPETVTGRVGVGTCGIGGQPMTKYMGPEKWRKGV